jgi:hypothetical protein
MRHRLKKATDPARVPKSNNEMKPNAIAMTIVAATIPSPGCDTAASDSRPHRRIV